MMTRTQRRGRLGWAALFGLGLLCLVASDAYGDEPPPPDTSPAEPTPPAAAESEPAKENPPAWSDPASPPNGGGALPPPMVRVRTGGAPAEKPKAPSIRDVPSELRAPAVEPEPRPEAAASTQPAGQAPAPQAEGAEDGRLPIAMTPSMLQSITKLHNVPRADGERVLQLEIEYEVAGEAGRNVYVGVWFVRKENGRYLRTAMWEYGDPQGYLTVQTRPARVAAGTARYLATVQIPYAAFPMRRAEGDYEVEARVHVLRRERGSMMTVLARGETTFTVHGAAAEAPETAPPAAPTAPAPTPVVEEAEPFPKPESDPDVVPEGDGESPADG